MSERVFLDANILVSAAWRANSRLLVLWSLANTQAIDAGATYLLTGDKDHFGQYYDRVIEGVTILRPARYIALRAE